MLAPGLRLGLSRATPMLKVPANEHRNNQSRSDGIETETNRRLALQVKITRGGGAASSKDHAERPYRNFQPVGAARDFRLHCSCTAVQQYGSIHLLHHQLITGCCTRTTVAAVCRAIFAAAPKLQRSLCTYTEIQQ